MILKETFICPGLIKLNETQILHKLSSSDKGAEKYND